MIFAVETVVFLAFRNRGILDPGVTDFQYIIKYIVLPTSVSFVLVTLCSWINKMDIKSQTKNYAILLTLSLLAAVIAFIHYIITSILSIFTIPVFLSILFGQKRLTEVIAAFNCLLLIISTVRSAAASDSPYFYLNAAVAYAMLFAAYMISRVLIEYNKENSDYIYTSYRTQLSLNEQIKNDSLTGLYNQKTFQTLLKKTMEKAKEMKWSMSLAIIDLDDFKEINDTFGHLEGDQVLLQFTELIKQQCDDGESFIARYGGDEFAVIFPRASKEFAFLRLEALRKRCRQVPENKVRSGSISFSAGISHYLEGDMNEVLLFHQADAALYQAKENGKGQIMVYPH